ncbi:unnamed protein product, partial [Protopolystoma xenopodis]
MPAPLSTALAPKALEPAEGTGSLPTSPRASARLCSDYLHFNGIHDRDSIPLKPGSYNSDEWRPKLNVSSLCQSIQARSQQPTQLGQALRPLQGRDPVRSPLRDFSPGTDVTT